MLLKKASKKHYHPWLAPLQPCDSWSQKQGSPPPPPCVTPFQTQLTFLFLLPSAPISVTGHRHCELSAKPAPHPATPRRPVHSFISNTQDWFKVWRSKRILLYKSVRLIALRGAKRDTIWRHKNTLIPSMGNVSANPPTSFAIQWDCKLVEFSSPCCSNYSSISST